jgi:hypothetical protein
LSVDPAVRSFAVEPGAFMERSPTSEWIEGDGYTLVCGATPTMNLVEQIRCTGESLDRAIVEVRIALAERERTWVQWLLAPSSTPVDAEDRLRAAGLVPGTGVPYEYRSAALALVTEPPGAPAGVAVRELVTADEMTAGVDVQFRAFGIDGTRRAAEAPAHPASWLEASARGAVGTFGAMIDGELAGVARASFTPCGAFLMGGSTLPRFRGRGAYHALVRARWDAAAGRETPALVTHAGRMARPILEQLGFVRVGELRALVDEGPWR